MMIKHVWAFMLPCLLALGARAAAPVSSVSWSFDGEGGAAWVRQVHQCRDVRAEGGVLKGTTAGLDPFLTSPSCDLAASCDQVIEFRAKCGVSGKGVIFWVPAHASGAQAQWAVSFDWIGDGEWHEYRVRPYWQAEKRIRAVRLDFVDGHPDVAFEVASLRVVNESPKRQSGEPSWTGAELSAWSGRDGALVSVAPDGLAFGGGGKAGAALVSPALALHAGSACVVALEAVSTGCDALRLAWASDAVSGLHAKTVRIRTDGRFHTYNFDLSSVKGWAGTILSLQLQTVVSNASPVRIRWVRVSDDAVGPADVTVEQARLEDAINRAGRPATLSLQLSNGGGADAEGLTLAVRSLPDGVKVVSGPGWERLPSLPALGRLSHQIRLLSERAVAGDAVFTLSGGGLPPQEVRAPVAFLADLKLPKAEYVPVPQPLKSDYEIGALYYPGWQSIEKWARIWPVAPERKPVLGWYDEANPEVVDWQIKWAVENGLSYLLVDWYWHKGSQHNDHWIKAFKQARYRSYLKWAVMWANHNSSKSHSEADQRAVTAFWIENYFNMPEYYRIDGMPVVMIWSPQNMERDVGPGGCRKLLEISRQMAREAGYKGIWFIAMKWPEASYDPKVVQGLKDMGFDMTSIYHYMHHGGQAENPRRFAFDLVADSNCGHWKGLQETGILPFLPNLSTGWDDRPWHGDRGTEIYGRTVKDFRRICRDAKRFADETGVKRLTLGPLNEWGEGSYAEPCAEFGFGMYESVRETFCQKPSAGWPLNVAPSDVGLGPYDLPMPRPDTTTDWTFAETAQGWSAMMGIKEFKAAQGLTFTTVTADPALERMMSPVSAKAVSRVVVRMRVPSDTPGACQLFWSTGGTPTESTSLSLPLVADGQMHDYVFEVGASRTWRGRIARLRLDPCNKAGVPVSVAGIRLVPASEK